MRVHTDWKTEVKFPRTSLLKSAEKEGFSQLLTNKNKIQKMIFSWDSVHDEHCDPIRITKNGNFEIRPSDLRRILSFVLQSMHQ